MTTEIEYKKGPPKDPDEPNPEDIRVLCTQFRLKTLMGIGMYGAIFSIYDDKSKVVKCVKNVVNPHHNAHKEREILARIQHYNVISILSSTVTSTYIYLVMERFDCDLYQYLQMEQNGGGTGLDPIDAENIMMQICSGLAACHERQIIHRDLKPSNILVDIKRQRIVLADFGISKYIGEDQMTGKKPTSHSLRVVSYPYRAPEIVLDADPHYTEKIDVWAAGCIFLELLCGKIMFNSASKECYITRVLNRFLKIDWNDLSKHRRLWYVNVDMDPPQRELWLAMMRREPVLRIGARDAYEAWKGIWNSRLKL